MSLSSVKLQLLTSCSVVNFVQYFKLLFRILILLCSNFCVILAPRQFFPLLAFYIILKATELQFFSFSLKILSACDYPFLSVAKFIFHLLKYIFTGQFSQLYFDNFGQFCQLLLAFFQFLLVFLVLFQSFLLIFTFFLDFTSFASSFSYSNHHSFCKRGKYVRLSNKMGIFKA